MFFCFSNLKLFEFTVLFTFGEEVFSPRSPGWIKDQGGKDDRPFQRVDIIRAYSNKSETYI